MTIQHAETKALKFTSTTLSTNDLSLEVLEGPHRGTSVRLTQEFIRIGRGAWCDLVLAEDKGVSKLHCECWFEDKGLRIREMNSRNGVRVDGVWVTDAFIEEGAKIQLGDSLLLLKSHQQQREIAIQYQDDTGKLVGRNREMRKIFSMINKLRARKVSTLLTGETGTGKTSIAHAIHGTASPEEPFVVVNCGALPGNLIESFLFGHAKGAFTGADKAHTGFFQQANGGTLFFDEIAELPLDLQPKLLDVLERRKVRKLGSEKEHKVDFRLISATHRNLQEEVEAGRFRKDLYFRIAVVELEVPPLRMRTEDLPLLAANMLHDLYPQAPIYLTKQASQALTSYLWPGNIRELRNVLERSITFLEGNKLDLANLALPKASLTPLPLRPSQASPAPTGSPNLPSPAVNTANIANAGGGVSDSLPSFPLSAHQQLSLKEILVEVECTLLSQALKEKDLNAPEAARLLGISESWLYSRIKRYGLASQRKQIKK